MLPFIAALIALFASSYSLVSLLRNKQVTKVFETERKVDLIVLLIFVPIFLFFTIFFLYCLLI